MSKGILSFDPKRLLDAVGVLNQRSDNELMMLALSELLKTLNSGQPTPPGIYYPLTMVLDQRAGKEVVAIDATK